MCNKDLCRVSCECGLEHLINRPAMSHNRCKQIKLPTDSLQSSRYLLNAPDVERKCNPREFFSHLSYRYQSRRPQNVTFIVLWAKFVQNANTTLLPAAVPGLGVYTRDWQPFTPIRREYCPMTDGVMNGRGYFLGARGELTEHSHWWKLVN